MMVHAYSNLLQFRTLDSGCLKNWDAGYYDHHTCWSINRSIGTISSNSVIGGCEICSECANLTGELLQSGITILMHSVMRLVFQQLYIFLCNLLFDVQFWAVWLILQQICCIRHGTNAHHSAIIMYTSLHPLTIIIIPVDMTLHHIYHINPLPLHIHT